MTTTTIPGGATALPGPLRLTWLHLKYQFLETVRVPVAVLGNLLFPALAMFFFVVPQKEVAQNPVAATTESTSATSASPRSARRRCTAIEPSAARSMR